MWIFLALLPLFARASNVFGEKFLLSNKGKPGVVTLESGLQYKVLRAGTGSYHPTLKARCACHYEGRIAENYPAGKTFDSSYARGEPITFAPNQVIKGWTIAMQHMVEGDKWELYIPSQLGYGASGMGPDIPGGSVLVFTMEILTITGKKTPAKKAVTKKELSVPSRIVCNVSNLIGKPADASFTLQVHKEWAPKGAKRLLELAESNFFDGVRFFRVIDSFMAQFGIHGDPSVARRWRDKNILDDARLANIGNKRGRVSFAMAGPNTRSTQFFINLVDNSRLDNMGFTPIAEVVDGMEVVDRIYKVGEGAPNGPGPDQARIQQLGNAYLTDKFPKLSYLSACRVAVAAGAPAISEAKSVEGSLDQDPHSQSELADAMDDLIMQPGIWALALGLSSVVAGLAAARAFGVRCLGGGKKPASE